MSFLDLSRHNIQFIKDFPGVKCNLLDLGAAATVDLYLLPLLCLPGVKCLLDGRGDDLEFDLQSQLQDAGLAHDKIDQIAVSRIDSFIADSQEKLFFYNKDSPTSSTFYPIVPGEVSLYTSYPKNYEAFPVKCDSLASQLPSNISPLHFSKIDIEGSEEYAIDELAKVDTLPDVLEIEIFLLERENVTNPWDFIKKLNGYGYELLDIRKNYWYKRIPHICPSNGKQLLAKLDIYGNQPSAMGRLSIIDALLVNRKNIESSVSGNDLFTVAFILSQYRQYNEALSLIVNDFPTDYIERFYGWMTTHQRLVSRLMQENPASVYGLHAYFNWLKHV